MREVIINLYNQGYHTKGISRDLEVTEPAFTVGAYWTISDSPRLGNEMLPATVPQSLP